MQEPKNCRMMSAEALNEKLLKLSNSLQETEESGTNSDTESEISLSEKIILESNEKRLRERMTSLQNSIMNLKEQLKLEKELWKEDMQKIRTLQQQQELKCTCVHQIASKDTLKCENASRSSSNYTLEPSEAASKKSFDDILKKHSIQQLLELQNYKRRLTETENMCNLELTRVKQSLEDLRILQGIASEWGKKEDTFQEIFVKRE